MPASPSQRLVATPPTVLAGHEAAVYALAPFGDGVLSGGGEGYVVYWPLGGAPDAVPAGRVVARVDDRVFCLHVDEAAARLWVGTLSGDVYCVGLAGGRGEGAAAAAPRRWRFHRDGVFALARAGSRGGVLAAGGDGRVSRWAPDGSRMLAFAEVDPTRVRSLRWLAGAGLLAAGTAGGDVHLLEPARLRAVHTIARAHEATVFTLASPRPGLLLSAGRDGAIRAWRAGGASAPFAQAGHVAAHAATVNALAFDARTGLLASAGRDRDVRLWRVLAEAAASDSTRAGVVDLELAKVLTGPRDGGHAASANAATWTRYGLVTAGDDRSVRFWPA